MSKFLSICAAAFATALVMCDPVLAQTTGTSISFSASFGVALTVIGAAYGIGRLAGSAVESMARQPEAAGTIQTAMIIAAALIEGFTFYALYICSTAVGK